MVAHLYTAPYVLFRIDRFIRSSWSPRSLQVTLTSTSDVTFYCRTVTCAGHVLAQGTAVIETPLLCGPAPHRLPFSLMQSPLLPSTSLTCAVS
jgi:hypothetical protein